MTRLSPASTVSSLVAAATLAACGGGGGGGETHSPQPIAVIGQASFAANQLGAVGAGTLNTPIGNVSVADDGTLFIPDAFNGRVLGYRNVPESSGVAADFVIGKASLDSPPTPAISQTELGSPVSVSTAAGKMAVADFLGNRVLIYDTVPTATGTAASRVVGQSSFAAKDSAGCTDSGLNAPSRAVLTPNGKLVVTDRDHHRVLIWNTVPQADGQRADVVVGQSDFVHCTANDANQDSTTEPAPSAATVSRPVGVWSDGHRLVVADTGNSRVLIWNQMPLDGAENFKPADVVLGQVGFGAGMPNDADGNGVQDASPAATTMAFPASVHSDGQRLAVADLENHRVLIWNTFPTQSGTPPDRVIGQPDFNHGVANDIDGDGTEDPTTTGLAFKAPRGVLLQGDKLFVTDSLNHRVVIIHLP